MSLYEWLLFLHVLAAFALVAAIVLYTALVLAARRLDVPSDVARLFRLSRVGDVVVGVGSFAALVLGIWLAFEAPFDYEIWDAWIVAAIVLWLAFGAVGQQAGRVYNAARDRARSLVAEGRDEPSSELSEMLRSRRGLVLQLASIIIVVAFLVDMIYKPGA